MKLPTSVTNMINSSTVSSSVKDDFRCQCQAILVALIIKFQERNPLSFAIVRNAIALSPNFMVTNKETAVAHFEALVSNISLLAAISLKVADNAKVEYEDFLNNDVTQNSDKFFI